jgi:3-phosphoshikimate 1-carboxyvinyltransferase
MSSTQLRPHAFRAGALRGEIRVPGDKSVSHRALMLGAYGSEPLSIRNLNAGRDVRATMEALITLGARVQGTQDGITIAGGRLREPMAPIDCMNSGSTARMMLGVCAGADVRAAFDGDASLSKRPMEPVAAQLRAFGAHITTTDGKLPLRIEGTPQIQTRRFILLTPSAQIKSALLLAGLYADTPVTVLADRGSRDHTERLMRYLGADVSWDGSTVELRSGLTTAAPVDVCGDFSSAAFFIVAAAVAPGSDLTIRDVGINPTRTGLLDALAQMGASIELQNARERSGEPVADVHVRYTGDLRGTAIGPDVALRAIDEIPVLAVAAAFAQGETKITGVKELRTKESDRVAAIERLLGAVGIETQTAPNGLTIHGGAPRSAHGVIETQHDHRTAMAAAALAAGAGALEIDSDSSIDVSFPTFLETLESVQHA